jgi:hypothetical protein
MYSKTLPEVTNFAPGTQNTRASLSAYSRAASVLAKAPR